MSGITTTRTIQAPAEVVFAAASDFAGAAGRIGAIERVEMLTDGPVGVGTRFRETRRMRGREASETMEVTLFEPPRRYVLLAESHGCRYESGLSFTPAGTPEGSATTVAMHFAAEPLTLPAKILAFLCRPMMKMVARACAKDLDDLARTVEGQGRDASG